jgi:hypothetical protein
MFETQFRRYTTDTAPEGSREVMNNIQGSCGFMPNPQLLKMVAS